MTHPHAPLCAVSRAFYVERPCGQPGETMDGIFGRENIPFPHHEPVEPGSPTVCAVEYGSREGAIGGKGGCVRSRHAERMGEYVALLLFRVAAQYHHEIGELLCPEQQVVDGVQRRLLPLDSDVMDAAPRVLWP